MVERDLTSPRCTTTRGRVVQYIGVQNDVTARVEAERALQRRARPRPQLPGQIEALACTDPLTGLPNRRRLQERVESALWEARAGRRGSWRCCSSTSTASRRSTTRLGHAAGDELLVEVARRLEGRLRRGDLLARLGGDEFLVALPGLGRTDARSHAEQVAADLRGAVEAPVEVTGGTATVRVSTGVGVFPDDGAEFRDLLHVADTRMYERKHALRG